VLSIYLEVDLQQGFSCRLKTIQMMGALSRWLL
jgi:hypothetical protein